MNKTNYLKIFGIAVLAFFLNTSLYAQSGSSKTQSQKAQPRVQKNAISAKNPEESKLEWVYTVVELNIHDDQIEVRADEPKEKPQTRSQEIAYKMASENRENLKKASQTFTTESDVLNYFAGLGYELVSVYPNAKNQSIKTYYLRSKLPE